MPAGTVYLIHLARPYCHARHYLGWAAGDVADRLAEHQATRWTPCEPYRTERGRLARGRTIGQGATFLAAVNAAGIPWQLVRTWPGDKTLEHQLRQRHEGPRLCPLCNPRAARYAP